MFGRKPRRAAHKKFGGRRGLLWVKNRPRFSASGAERTFGLQPRPLTLGTALQGKGEATAPYWPIEANCRNPSPVRDWTGKPVISRKSAIAPVTMHQGESHVRGVDRHARPQGGGQEQRARSPVAGTPEALLICTRKTFRPVSAEMEQEQRVSSPSCFAVKATVGDANAISHETMVNCRL